MPAAKVPNGSEQRRQQVARRTAAAAQREKRVRAERGAAEMIIDMPSARRPYADFAVTRDFCRRAAAKPMPRSYLR